MPQKPHKNIKIQWDHCHECYKNLKEGTKITMQLQTSAPVFFRLHSSVCKRSIFYFLFKFSFHLSSFKLLPSLLCFRMLWCPGVWKVRLVAGPSPSAVMAWTSSLYRLAGWRPDTSRVLLSWKRGEEKEQAVRGESERKKQETKVFHAQCVKLQGSYWTKCFEGVCQPSGPRDLPVSVSESISVSYVY